MALLNVNKSSNKENKAKKDSTENKKLVYKETIYIAKQKFIEKKQDNKNNYKGNNVLEENIQLGKYTVYKNMFKDKMEDLPKWTKTLIIMILIVLISLTLIIKNINGGGEDTSVINSKKIEKIEIDVDTNKVGKTKGSKINVKVTPYDAYTKDLELIISNKKAIRYDKTEETVYGVDKGKATIKFANKYISSNEIDLESVDLLEKIDIENKISELTIKKEYEFKYKYYPETAYNKTVYIESSNPDVVEVTKEGKIYTKKQGNTKLVFKDSYGNVLEENILEVKWDRITDIKLDETNIIMGKEQDYGIYAKITPENATFTDIVWRSNNEDIARVDKNGIITALKEGRTEIVAEALNEGIQKAANITIVKDKVYGEKRYIKQNQNVHILPDITKEIITTVKENEKVEILKDLEGWYKIRTKDGKIGYIDNKDNILINI